MEYRHWTNNKVLHMIELYKSRPVLWDPANDHYKSSKKKYDAWDEIAGILDIEVSEIKKKMNSIQASFRRERQRERLGRKKHGEGNYTYKSHWFAFKALSFLFSRPSPHDDKVDSNEVADTTDDYEDDDSDKDPLTAVEVEINQDQPSTQYIDLPHSPNENPLNEPTTMFDDARFPLDENAGPSTSAYYSADADSNVECFKQVDTISKKRRMQSFPAEMSIGDVSAVYQAINHSRDECSLFGEYVANKLRSLDRRNRCIVEHSINNLLFVAEMGRLSPPTDQNVFSQVLPNAIRSLLGSHPEPSRKPEVRRNHRNDSSLNPNPDSSIIKLELIED